MYCSDHEQFLLLGVGQYSASDWQLFILEAKLENMFSGTILMNTHPLELDIPQH